MRIDKARKFLNIANFTAQELSKDTSTKVGCLLMDPSDYSVLSIGYNGFPRGCDDTDILRLARPEKYLWTEHSERNALYNMARKDFKGGTIFIHTIPTMNDARALVSTGITSVIIRDMTITCSEQEKALLLFKETNTLVQNDKYNFAWDITSPIDALIHSKNNISLGKGTLHARFEDSSSMEGPICSAIADYFIKNKLLIGMAAVVTLMPCIDCAAALINCGIHTIVSKVPDNPDLRSRWENNFALSKKLLNQHNTKFMLFDSDDTVLFNNISPSISNHELVI